MIRTQIQVPKADYAREGKSDLPPFNGTTPRERFYQCQNQ